MRKEGIITEGNRIYAAIDLKSFYASVECVDLGYDPLETNLVVADLSRTDKTICLAVSPALKSFSVPGRPRLFEVRQKVGNINSERRKQYGSALKGKSIYAPELNDNPALALDFLIAPPRMHRYMEVSQGIYDIYLEFVSEEDIHVYSVDEVFIDLTPYLKTYKLNPYDLTMKIVREVYFRTGITATAGIGTNLYLSKIAMDIVAKRMPPDECGVRIASLTEKEYREKLWNHRPLTDFWRIGGGYEKKLASFGMFTMGDIARKSVTNADLFYKLFGVNAELLIDHAWGKETCLMRDIKSYRTENNSLSSGQVLKKPYKWDSARNIVMEMTDALVLDMVRKRVYCDQMVLNISYDTTNTVTDSSEISRDYYGRTAPAGSHGSINLPFFTSSSKIIREKVLELFDKITNRSYTIRRINVCANHVRIENSVPEKKEEIQYDMFTDYRLLEEEKLKEKEELEKEKDLQHTILDIQSRFGKNAILKGNNFREDATARERNAQIGGHKA